jgi:hypothetical protein
VVRISHNTSIEDRSAEPAKELLSYMEGDLHIPYITSTPQHAVMTAAIHINFVFSGATLFPLSFGSLLLLSEGYKHILCNSKTLVTMEIFNIGLVKGYAEVQVVFRRHGPVKGVSV